jgi:hypothetical protein
MTVTTVRNIDPFKTLPDPTQKWSPGTAVSRGSTIGPFERLALLEHLIVDYVLR